MDSPKITLTIFGKTITFTKKELTEFYKMVGVSNPEREADLKFKTPNQTKKEKEQERLEQLINDPDKLVEKFEKCAKLAYDMDYLTTGGFSQEAFDLLKYMPTDKLKELLKGLDGEYKEEAERILREREKETATHSSHSHPELPSDDGR